MSAKLRIDKSSGFTLIIISTPAGSLMGFDLDDGGNHSDGPGSHDWGAGAIRSQGINLKVRMYVLFS